MTATKKIVVLSALLGVFLMCVLFLSLKDAEKTAAVEKVVLLAGADFAGEAVTAPAAPEFDRAAFVQEMREAVLARAPEEPPVTTAVTLEEERDSFGDVDGESGLAATDREVRWCDATLLESKFLASWPQSGVAVSDAEGALVFSASLEVPVGTTTETEIVTTALAQFPLRPVRTTEPSCLMHSYVGVTLGGRLIHNNDTVLFTSKAATEQIGYAFDGNPIYGASASSEKLDGCGGSDESGEYRYQLRSDEDFVLGCFVSPSQQNLQRG